MKLGITAKHKIKNKFLWFSFKIKYAGIKQSNEFINKSWMKSADLNHGSEAQQDMRYLKNGFQFAKYAQKKNKP